MKKKIFLIFLFFIVFLNIYANDRFVFKWNFGDLGIGMNAFDNNTNFEQFFSILNIGIEHQYSGIGIELTPVKSWSWSYYPESFDNKESRDSYLNLNIYWNMFDIGISDNNAFRFFFGPFNKLNYLFYKGNDFMQNEFIYTAGVRFGLGWYITDFIYFNVIGGEIGYRNVSGKSAFYLSGQIDFVIYIAGYIGSVINNP
ncbi:MAG: hypothetical protein FWC01_04825 [Treponema sp.]|nr:hypothetical protein [Treponema sp.]MCL2237266.1 hypothetical protein [Treponema sp.]